MIDRLKRIMEQARSVVRRFYRYRSLRLTPEGARFLALSLAVGVAAFNTGNNLLYLLLAMMLTLIVVSGILSEQSLKQLAFRRWLPPHVFAGQPVTAALSVTNEKPLFPSFSLRVNDVREDGAANEGIRLLHLPPGASVTRSYRVLFPRRGLDRLDGVKVVTRFPFGLFMKAATVPLSSALVVYPALQPISPLLAQELESMGHDREIPRRGQGVGLYNLRAYQPGDDSRTIHWKTSARQARFIVRETEAEDQREVTLALPTAGPARPESFERAVSLTASLVVYFHERAFAVRLLLGAQETSYGTAEAHLHQLLRMLALCHPTGSRGHAMTVIPHGFWELSARTALGELSIIILPWEDPEFGAACRGVTRILETWRDS